MISIAYNFLCNKRLAILHTTSPLLSVVIFSRGVNLRAVAECICMSGDCMYIRSYCRRFHMHASLLFLKSAEGMRAEEICQRNLRY